MKGRPCSSFTTEAISELVSTRSICILTQETNPGTYRYLEGIWLARVPVDINFVRVQRTHGHLAGLVRSFVDRANVPAVLQDR